MGKSPRTRWVCPECGDGKLGSRRPRMDDVVRYCLECSGRVGTLVRRTSPKLEADRLRSRERSRDKAAKNAELVRQHERDLWTVRGMDMTPLRHALDRLVRERVGYVPTWRKPQWSKVKFHGSGCCWVNGTIHLRFSPSQAPADAAALMLHEAAHAATPGEHHGPKFKSTEQEFARRLWPHVDFKFYEIKGEPTMHESYEYVGNGVHAHLLDNPDHILLRSES